MYILIKIYAPKHSLTLLLLVVPQDTVDRRVSQQGPEALTQVPKYNRLRKKTHTRHLSSLLSQLCPFRAGLLNPIIASSKSTKLFLWSNPVVAGDSISTADASLHEGTRGPWCHPSHTGTNCRCVWEKVVHMWWDVQARVTSLVPSNSSGDPASPASPTHTTWCCFWKETPM